MDKIANSSLLKMFFFSQKRFPGHLLLFFQAWKRFSAIVPKTSKVIRNCSNFQEFLSKMLLCKCSSGYVKSAFDNLAKNFAKNTSFSCQSPKMTMKQLFKMIFFITFLLRTLRLLFRHTWLLFWQNQEKLTQSLIKVMIV